MQGCSEKGRLRGVGVPQFFILYSQGEKGGGGGEKTMGNSVQVITRVELTN